MMVYQETGQPVKVGDKVHTKHGGDQVVVGITEPLHRAHDGRVKLAPEGTSYGTDRFPSVIGAIWSWSPE